MSEKVVLILRGIATPLAEQLPAQLVGLFIPKTNRRSDFGMRGQPDLAEL